MVNRKARRSQHWTPLRSPCTKNASPKRRTYLEPDKVKLITILHLMNRAEKGRSTRCRSRKRSRLFEKMARILGRDKLSFDRWATSMEDTTYCVIDRLVSSIRGKKKQLIRKPIAAGLFRIREYLLNWNGAGNPQGIPYSFQQIWIDLVDQKRNSEMVNRLCNPVEGFYFWQAIAYCLTADHWDYDLIRVSIVLSLVKGASCGFEFDMDTSDFIIIDTGTERFRHVDTPTPSSPGTRSSTAYENELVISSNRTFNQFMRELVVDESNSPLNTPRRSPRLRRRCEDSRSPPNTVRSNRRYRKATFARRKKHQRRLVSYDTTAIDGYADMSRDFDEAEQILNVAFIGRDKIRFPLYTHPCPGLRRYMSDMLPDIFNTELDARPEDFGICVVRLKMAFESVIERIPWTLIVDPWVEAVCKLNSSCNTQNVAEPLQTMKQVARVIQLQVTGSSTTISACLGSEECAETLGIKPTWEREQAARYLQSRENLALGESLQRALPFKKSEVNLHHTTSFFPFTAPPLRFARFNDKACSQLIRILEWCWIGEESTMPNWPELQLPCDIRRLYSDREQKTLHSLKILGSPLLNKMDITYLLRAALTVDLARHRDWKFVVNDLNGSLWLSNNDSLRATITLVAPKVVLSLHPRFAVWINTLQPYLGLKQYNNEYLRGLIAVLSEAVVKGMRAAGIIDYFSTI